MGSNYSEPFFSEKKMHIIHCFYYREYKLIIIYINILDKWLSPSDTSHPPSVLAVLVFCRACEDFEALRVIVRAVGMDLMTPEDRRLRDYAEADLKMREARKWKKRLEEGL